MTALAIPVEPVHDLPTLVDRAATAIASARSAAEVLEARDLAALAYDVAQRASRLHKARQAHDDLIAAAHRTQAHALEIEAAAKRRLADEYDAAQQRGEVATRGGERSGREHSPSAPSAADLGLSRKEIHEARLVRDAERAEPGITRRTLDERLARGEEPTRTALRQAARDRLDRAVSGLKAAESTLRRLETQPAPVPLSEADRDRQRRIFGTQEDRAIVARLEEIVERIAEQPAPADAVRRIPPASVHTVETDAIRRAARWLDTFCNLFDTGAPDGIEAAE